jgi:structural maintenance of chromosome 1
MKVRLDRPSDDAFSMCTTNLLYLFSPVDAALDNVNLRKVCNYISHRSKEGMQCIVISLKDMFYEHSEGLVGICKDVATNSSRT